MAFAFVGPGSRPGLQPETIRYRLQYATDGGRWEFDDNYVYDWEEALGLFQKSLKQPFRIVKVSWANFSAVHSVVRVK